jgi:Fis family transcriptional regulator
VTSTTKNQAHRKGGPINPNGHGPNGHGPNGHGANGHGLNGHGTNGHDLPLRGHAERALSDYFTRLNGHCPARLYDLVLREVEEPLLRMVLDYAQGNQSRAATILGINRGTLRKKLKQFGLGG